MFTADTLDTLKSAAFLEIQIKLSNEAVRFLKFQFFQYQVINL